MLSSTVSQKHIRSRSRAVQSEFRKRQIIDATVNCINRLGLSQTTLASIAKEAEVSQGVIVFHFKSKEALLDKVLLNLSREYNDCWEKAIKQSDSDPINQLIALVSATFTASICNRKKISVWYAFWGESRAGPKYRQICGQLDKQFEDTLLLICQQIEQHYGGALSAQTASLSISAMIDGLWQNFLIGDPDFNRHKAIKTIYELVEVIYPNHIQQAK